MFEKINELIPYLKPYKKKAIIGGMFMLLNILLLLPTPLITMYLIDNVLPKNNFYLLSVICTAIIALLLVKAIASFFQNLYLLKFNERVIFDIQLDLFQKIQIYPTQYRHKKQTGYLISRVKDDPNRLQGLFANTGLAIIRDILTFIVGISIIFVLHWKLALASIAILPFFVSTLFFFSRRIRNLSSISYEKSALVTKKIEESISLLDTFKIFNAEKYDAIKLVHYMKDSVRSFIKKSVIGSLSGVITGFIGGLGPIVVIWYGMAEIMNGNLSLGKLIAFNSYIGYLFGPTSRLININTSIQQSLAAWERIHEILHDQNHEFKSHQKSLSKTIRGAIHFDHVCFAYDDDDLDTIIDFNYHFEAYSCTGIVGESGSGKSSLVRLIPVVNTVRNGKITIDGIPINEINIKSLRSQIALVDQEPVLFHDTIYNNIKLGNRHTSEEDIIQAAIKAQIHKFILSLPDGYNTIVDERGINMSVGQKQRIAIARAILRDPAILILDEPTSNIDSKSENLILSTMKPFIKGRTTIIIAHRLSTITFADSIIVMDKGRIVETGTHQELLMKPNGYYRKLWEKQSPTAIPV